MKNYYEILEVNERASQEIIEKAYKILVKKYHPDLYTGEEKIYAEQKVRDLNEAYQVLSDGFLKSQYDLELQKEKDESHYEFKYGTNNRIENKKNSVKSNVNKKTNVKNNENKKVSSNNSPMNFKWRSKKKNPANENNIGTIRSTMKLLNDVIKIIPRKGEWSRKKSKEESKLDYIAMALTILCLIIIGIILWFVPFTNGWMRQLIFENPLFSWIWS